MTLSVFLVQLLNGVQFGVLLFLLSAGLTLVLGIMGFVNLMHGSLFMLGAYFSVTLYGLSGSFVLAGAGAVFATASAGLLLERLVLRRLYARSHLDQVLATFGLILISNEVVRAVWGPAARSMDVPAVLSHTVSLFGLPYPTYRFAVIGVGLAIAIGMYVLIHRTRLGIWIRAAASNAPMSGAMGINVQLLNMAMIGLGAALAALAGLMAAPLSSVQAGMGEPILIMTLVVIVTGGIGSVRGAFYGALIVGVIETLGRTLLPLLLRELVERSTAQAIGPTIASMLIYLVMAAVLVYRPQGLFAVKHA
ncbi:MAG: branched-chain amino acid ABC transporter permease [Burkholderiaceae bacterium]|nr:branched-chain amino acid ABC transporter permease [Burkholderiaceae bacterium]MEB2350356.1 branched-chain amino acid ABC transporter permease [Burkholderiaceae bacterium]